ncbi:hypothetical protein WN944_012801 [Citrus x changshan-huyou]|uniref:Uncharacterized protein n=1 Tax=Citrus x changshan-huyou TaxID=2935761 RepID=A0AAP0M2Q4_9ROSI
MDVANMLGLRNRDLRVYKGGAYLYVPLGKWLTSNLTLFLERGATILGSQMPAFDIFLVSGLHSTVPLPGNDANIDG